MGLKINNKNVAINNCWYYMGFLKGLYYRSSCYKCQYAEKDRVADITFGDFGGLGRLNKMPNLLRKNGVNVVLANTVKFDGYIHDISPMQDWEERCLEEAVNGNRQLRYASRHLSYVLFKVLFLMLGFVKAARLCLLFDNFFYFIIVPWIGRMSR